MESQISIFMIIFVILAGIVGFILYFIPSIVAFKRETASKWAIFLVNFFFGWTLLVWIVTLIWACEGRTEK